ncbi:MAG: PKD domain-containing protein [Candidatus Marinimicrobia bacterium]|jgi:PKD repeat protein|nr:PKD domain-containing protein [Candidatus Neomarinimicrobiota bacterium]
MKKIILSTFLILTMIVVSCEDDEAAVEAPTARFTYTVDADNGLLVNFTNSSLNADTYSWGFGDGETSTDMSPSHTYAADGLYDVTLTATNSGGSNSVTEELELTSVLTLADLNDTWKVAPVAGALAVGPSQGDGSWWSLSEADVTTRACFMDDKYTLSADGSFSIAMDGETWLETWQADSEVCGSPVSPYDGSGSYTYEATETTLTVSGEGAFMGLPKANNAGELPNVDVPTSITYTITEFVRDGAGKRLVLDVECGTGVWWRFTFVSQ